MITIETLKENRELVIETITEKVGKSNVKKVMSIMVEMIGFKGYENYNVVEFTEAVIDDNDITPEWEKFASDPEEMYKRASLNQRPSSMR